MVDGSLRVLLLPPLKQVAMIFLKVALNTINQSNKGEIIDLYFYLLYVVLFIDYYQQTILAILTILHSWARSLVTKLL